MLFPFKKRGALACAAVPAVLAFMFAMPVDAQVTGATLSGLVKDPSGAAIPVATVSIRNPATGETRDRSANRDGVSPPPNPPPGRHEGSTATDSVKKTVERGMGAQGGEQRAERGRGALGPGGVHWGWRRRGGCWAAAWGDRPRRRRQSRQW